MTITVEDLRLIKTGKQLSEEIEAFTRNRQVDLGFYLNQTTYDFPITTILEGPMLLFQIRIELFQHSQPTLVATIEHENGKAIGDQIRAHDIEHLFSLLRAQLEYLMEAASQLLLALIDRRER